MPFTLSPFKLAVTHPATGVCVVAVDGELDLHTVPLLHTCIREQLAAVPGHLILDLQPVRFMGSTGLRCLLDARELTEGIPGAQLHLAGLVTRAVARPLQVTELLELFNTYPTLTDALTALRTETAHPPSPLVDPFDTVITNGRSTA